MLSANKTVLVDITVSNYYDNSRESVTVKVYQDGDLFHAIPILDEGTRRTLRLPSMFSFRFMDQCLIPAKGSKEEDVELMKQIVMGIE